MHSWPVMNTQDMMASIDAGRAGLQFMRSWASTDWTSLSSSPEHFFTVWLGLIIRLKEATAIKGCILCSV